MTDPHPAPPLALAGAIPEEVAAALAGVGEPAWRAKPILAWVHRRGAKTLGDMTDLPRGLRERCAAAWRPRTTTVRARHDSEDGTVKLVIACADGAAIEAVLIPEADRRTLCVSTQVGCGMACRFCATGTMGLVRNLTAAEIVEQVLHARDLLAGESPTNVVFMGMGEPLANFAALERALRVLNADWGTGIGARRMTVSTVGLPDRIRDLAALDLEVGLAVSLHAPDDAIRTAIVPPNAKTGIAALVAAARDYAGRTGRRVTFEYVLLRGVNDQPAHARALARLLGGADCLVNLLPMNPVPGLPDRAPDDATVDAFARALALADVRATIRRRRGDDIAAACGQLALSPSARGTPVAGAAAKAPRGEVGAPAVGRPEPG